MRRHLAAVSSWKQETKPGPLIDHPYAGRGFRRVLPLVTPPMRRRSARPGSTSSSIFLNHLIVETTKSECSLTQETWMGHSPRESIMMKVRVPVRSFSRSYTPRSLVSGEADAGASLRDLPSATCSFSVPCFHCRIVIVQIPVNRCPTNANAQPLYREVPIRVEVPCSPSALALGLQS